MACIPPANPFLGKGPQCEDSSQCCQVGLNKPRGCFPFVPNGQTYCKPCSFRNEPAIDVAAPINVSDYGECCTTDQQTFTYTDELGVVRTVCSTGCRFNGESCNSPDDCCADTSDCLLGLCTEPPN
jgi:hypothetical protein